MVRLINLTPHAIHIVGQDGNPVLTVPPSGTVARCAVTRGRAGALSVWANAIGGHTPPDEDHDVTVPITHSVFGDVEGLPGKVPGTFYIVSSIVAQACPRREDLLVPDDTVRDDKGQVIGCRSLAWI